MIGVVVMLSACGPPPVETGIADAGLDTAGDLGESSLYQWADGEPACHWFYSAGPIDEHSLFIVDIKLPMEDFDAGIQVSYERELDPDEFQVWHDDAAETSADLFVCNDNYQPLIGRVSALQSGQLTLSATPEGPDEACGSPQTFDVVWSLTNLVTDDGAIPDIGPRSGRAGFFEGCYG